MSFPPNDAAESAHPSTRSASGSMVSSVEPSTSSRRPERVDSPTALTADSEPAERVEGRVIPLIPDAAGEPAPAGDSGPRAPLMADPATTDRFRPQILTALSSIFDPEIPVNIYELGLIYDITVDGEASVDIRMTLTAPGCPAALTLPGQVEQRVRDILGVKNVHVEVVWDPPWTKDRMSDAAKLQLGIF